VASQAAIGQRWQVNQKRNKLDPQLGTYYDKWNRKGSKRRKIENLRSTWGEIHKLLLIFKALKGQTKIARIAKVNFHRKGNENIKT